MKEINKKKILVSYCSVADTGCLSRIRIFPSRIRIFPIPDRGSFIQKNLGILLQCCGYGMFIPDPNFSIPDPNFSYLGSWIRIKEFKYFNPKELFLSSRKYDPGCSSRIRILTHPGSRIQRSERHRIPDPDPQHCLTEKQLMTKVLQT